ncbi:ribonuclease III domain-containing protein [Thamnocephalis sphaerospora]|uniref:Large ribosomal subunit protein mL44 n=1 Tax=Thamnocephalis sphaerospora TaxID=78915 RepID=A0A4P9XPK5_9FUNG|nr:ribonuclease III domain-containing protein [Thamnocephalis sphaerospora]|eukprot:RKP07928.1 ribonuclease III domain-containing protein [Thamnocephalis sphaerospora]
MSPALSAFATRVGLGNTDPAVLLQAVTHKSFKHGSVATSERLEYLGDKAIGLFVLEHVHLKYPVLPAQTVADAVYAYSGTPALAAIAREIGLQRVMRWKSNEDSTQGIETVSARVFRALVGAVYHQHGSRVARQFIHEHILSRKVNVDALLPLQQPKRLLSALMKRKNMERPVSRIIHETGRLSNAPVFQVGVYTGTKKIGEGYGSSIKMAEHRAAKDALLTYYMSEVKDFMYPSDFEGLPEEETITFVPQPLGDTQVIL